MQWHRKVIAVALAGVSAATIASVASGGPAASKQRIAIEGKFNIASGKSTFALVPLSKGQLTRDSGAGVGTGSAKPRVLQKNGQSVITIVGGDTLTGKRGTIALKEKVESHAAGHGYSADTGTWTFDGLTGDYAGFTGSGGFAATGLPNGMLIFRMEGYVSRR